MSRGRGVPAGLSPAQIARAALTLADDEGLAALTIRGVAQRLDVKPMAIYNHFASKDAMLDAVWDEVLGSAVLAEDHPETSWQGYLRRTALGYRQALLAHPNVLPAMLDRHARTAQSLDLVQTVIAGLTARGVPLMLAVDLVNVISVFVIAHALAERRSAGQTELPPIDPDRHALLVQVILASADADDAADDERRFTDAVDALVLGYTARIDRNGSLPTSSTAPPKEA